MIRGMAHTKPPSTARTALYVVLLATALYAAFLWPLPRRFASGIPYGSYAGDAAPQTLVQGDHLQLLYHFELFGSFLRGETPWMRNLYEFNTGDADVPRRIDPYYFPFALPHALLRGAGASDAFAWNACQWLSVVLGLAFCFALARRHGAGPGAALAVAALAACVPYRWVTLSGGSPTGFGMGLVPGVALGVDLAVRDRSVRGGLLAGALVLCCYAADLHCFLFSVLALPLWGLVALLRSPDNPFARRRRFLRLCAALSPIALGGAATAALGMLARSAYEKTDVSGGRTLSEIERLSPDWHAFFDPTYFSHLPEQFHMGRVLPLLLTVAGVVLLAAFLAAAIGLIRRRKDAPFRTPAILFHPAFFRRTDRSDAPGPWRRSAFLRAAFAGLLLAAAILFAFLLALGTHGPCEALPLRLVRKLVPPFRMVRQPIKVFCLLPALYSAFFALAWGALPCLARALRHRPKPEENLSPVAAEQRRRAGPAEPRPAALALRRAAPFAAAALLVVLAPRSAARGMRAGVCLLPGPNAAYEAARADAEARGLTPRALALPIWPGDSSWSSVYQYSAVLSRLRMLNGYAAVTTPGYVDGVFHRFETMTEGDLTVDQLAGLRELGVTAVILHENAFPPKVSPFPFGATIRRHLADPRLRLLARDGDAWAFAIVGGDGPAAPFAPALEAPSRHWGVRPPQRNARTKVRSFAEIHREGYGWLVRAEAGRDLVLVAASADASVTNRFPADPSADDASAASRSRLAWCPAPDPGPTLWTHLATPGEALISYVAYARDPASGGLPAPDSGGVLRLAAVDLFHDFGTTTLERIPDADGPADVRLEPDDLLFVPELAPACLAAEGPFLPLALPAGRYRAELLAEPDEIVAAQIDTPLNGVPARFRGARLYSAPLPPFRFAGMDGADAFEASPDGQSLLFSYDGTSPVSFRVSYDGTRPGALSLIAISPVPTPP